MTPYFSFLNYKDSNYQLNDGFINNIQVAGDNIPLTITVSGPNGYTAGPFVTPTTIPALTNLEPGIYTLTVTDTLLDSSDLQITIGELPQTILTSNVNEPCDCANCECVISVTNYIHNSNCFTYNLYKDGVLIDTYSACTGSEAHDFTGLCNGQYSIEAVETDIIVYTYNNPGGCEDGTIVFDENSDPDNIVSNWTRFCFYGNSVVYNGTTNMPSGLDPITGIISNAAGTYFERGNAYDLGDFNIPMNEGDNIGPVSANDPANYYKYYYNTAINKYVVSSNTRGGSPLEWATFDPRVDQGNIGNPTACQFLTSASNWGTIGLTSNQYTIDSSNIVVPATTKLTTFPKMIQCNNNSGLINGFYSLCNFNNYTHEVTIGSTDNDDDNIYIVLAAFKDTSGLYGPVNQTHTLTLSLTSNGGIFILYNAGNSAYGLTTPGTIALPAYSSPVCCETGSQGTTNPPRGWRKIGNVRIKIVKSGTSFQIFMTDTMGDQTGDQLSATVNVGGVNPYNSTPIFDFDLADTGTWNPAIVGTATGDELLKFTNNIKIGYATASQSLSQFFDIAFNGEQVTTSSSNENSSGTITQTDHGICSCYTIRPCTDDELNTKNRKIVQPMSIMGPFPLTIGKIYKFSSSELQGDCYVVEEDVKCSEDSIVSDILEEFENCESCAAQRCYDLVNCNQECDDILNISTIDLSSYLGQLVTVNGNTECIYSPVALREAIFINVPSSVLSNPASPFQNGSDVTLTLTSLIFNGTEQVTTAITDSFSALDYDPVDCSLLACTGVPANTTENCVGNIPTFLSQAFNSLGVRLDAMPTSPDACDTLTSKLEQFKIQYRDGDTFSFQLTINYNGSNFHVTGTVNAGNTTDVIFQQGGDSAPQNFVGCNTDFYCTDPDEDPTLEIAVWDDVCPQPFIEVGKACEITPRLGEPGFSTKNCDPQKVIDIKTKYADSVFALFKRLRYGIETCCEFDLDKIDIKNQLIDLGSIYDPEMCVDAEPLPDCCPQPCNAEVELLVPLSVTCPAPTAPVAVLLTTSPIPEECNAPTSQFGHDSVRGRVLIVAGSCVTVTLTGIDNGIDSSYIATECDSSPINVTLGPGVSATYCVDTSQPITNNNIQAIYSNICT